MARCALDLGFEDCLAEGGGAFVVPPGWRWGRLKALLKSGERLELQGDQSAQRARRKRHGHGVFQRHPPAHLARYLRVNGRASPSADLVRVAPTGGQLTAERPEVTLERRHSLVIGRVVSPNSGPTVDQGERIRVRQLG